MKTQNTGKFQFLDLNRKQKYFSEVTKTILPHSQQGKNVLLITIMSL